MKAALIRSLPRNQILNPASRLARPVIAQNQADFFAGGQNSITLPRCCGGTHCERFEKLVGM